MRFIDFVLDAFFDLKIENGDIAVANSNQQDIELILMLEKGELKQHPLLGVGLTKYLKSPKNNTSQLEREVRVNLELDGFKVNDVDFVNGLENIDIDADR
jgi:hypothetical protein